MSIWACVMAVTASPREAPGARLKEMVAEGNCPRWETCNGAVSSRNLAITASGTGVEPTDDGREMSDKDCNEVCSDGSASRMTRYWLELVKMVETMRWP